MQLFRAFQPVIHSVTVHGPFFIERISRCHVNLPGNVVHHVCALFPIDDKIILGQRPVDFDVRICVFSLSREAGTRQAMRRRTERGIQKPLFS